MKVITANVTNYDQLRDALKGVDTVYATFAVIKFSQRLKHEYAVSHSVRQTITLHPIHIKQHKNANTRSAPSYVLLRLRPQKQEYTIADFLLFFFVYR